MNQEAPSDYSGLESLRRQHVTEAAPRPRGVFPRRRRGRSCRAAAVEWTGRFPAPAGHDMAAMGPVGAGESKPVALSPTERQRIGVTFAPVTVGPLVRTVRVVGLVKEDETRVRAITARVDGFVERLDVDFTGRLVRAGEPLLGLYAPEAVMGQTELLLALNLERSVNAADAEAKASAGAGWQQPVSACEPGIFLMMSWRGWNGPAPWSGWCRCAPPMMGS